MQTFRLTLGAACLTLAAGCYSLQPVAGVAAPVDGTQVAFDVSDAGRVALGGAMGPSILHVEGRLVRRESDDFVVAVSSVSYLGGGTQAWSGEPVRFKPEYVNTTYVRRLSKSRTIAASALAIGAVAFFVTRSVVGGGTVDPLPPPRDSIGTTSRGPRP